MKSSSGEGLHGKGAPLGDGAAWVRAARGHVIDLLEETHAVVHPELEARLHEEGIPHGTGRLKFDPHVISEAVSLLKTLGVITERPHITKGGRSIPVLTLADTARRETVVRQAVRRKGMLYARFRLLADSAGDAGELVVRHSMSRAGPHLIPVTEGFGEAARFLGTELRGPLDSAAWLFSTDPTTGQPHTIALPVEVKNRRQVLYPIHKEVHQLLAKASAIQEDNPTNDVVPVLVCRRAHSRLFWMARDLGFRVHESRRQFVFMPKNLDQRKVQEVRDELRLGDLTVVPRTTDEGPIPRVRQFFQATVPKTAPDAAPRWAAAAPVISSYSEELRDASVDPVARQEMLREMRQELEVALDEAGFTDDFRSWSLPDLDE